MKYTIQAIFFCLLISITGTTLANTQQQIESSIDSILKKYPDITIGIAAYSLTNNRAIYKKNSDQPLMPASVLKIMTSIAALSFLGPTYQFQTRILTKNAAIDRGIINHDLYFYFDGDPSLTDYNINSLIKQLTTLGIHTIQGNIYVDDTIFDDANIGNGWVWEDLSFCYAAPISSIMIDKNCLGLRLNAAQNSHQPSISSKNINTVSITNDVTLKNPNNSGCSLKFHASSNNDYHLSGCLKNNAKPVDLSVAIRNVRLYSKNLIAEHLRESNITLTGSIEFKKTPIDAPLYLLAEHKSEPLATMIKFMLKKSDNTTADTIYKKLGSAFFNKQASWQDGAAAIKKILTIKNSDIFNKMRMDDGSGLSRYSLITPTQLAMALSYAYHNEYIRQTFIDSLPNAGVDGTLSYRMPNLKNRVYAKTGNMENSSSLAGYIKTKNQDMLAFSIIVNSFLGSPRKYHKLLDDVCTVLANS